MVSLKRISLVSNCPSFRSKQWRIFPITLIYDKILGKYEISFTCFDQWRFFHHLSLLLSFLSTAYHQRLHENIAAFSAFRSFAIWLFVDTDTVAQRFLYI